MLIPCFRDLTTLAGGAGACVHNTLGQCDEGEVRDEESRRGPHADYREGQVGRRRPCSRCAGAGVKLLRFGLEARRSPAEANSAAFMEPDDPEVAPFFAIRTVERRWRAEDYEMLQAVLIRRVVLVTSCVAAALRWKGGLPVLSMKV